MRDLKKHFLLDPEVAFLNHGSFGATPLPVFEEYQRWQLHLERQPVLFLGREYDSLLRQAREALGGYLNAAADDLVYIPNATHGVNIVARCLDLQPGDEILSTDHEYGACDYTWDFACKKTGAVYVRQPIDLPVTDDEEIVEQFFRGLSSRTKAIYLSHITSPTALRLPVESICRRARELGITSIVDAAHSPGQILLDLKLLDADVVFGNCHKWMLAPKGAAFLYVRREFQDQIDPLIVSWGTHPTPETTNGSRFIDILQWTGTRDPAAALSVPAAIRFMQDQAWDEVRSECRGLLQTVIQQICSLTGLPPLYPLETGYYNQMAVAPLPAVDPLTLQRRMYDEYKVEVPITQWRNRYFVRVSVQGYNTEEDTARLVTALQTLLPQVSL